MTRKAIAALALFPALGASAVEEREQLQWHNEQRAEQAIDYLWDLNPALAPEWVHMCLPDPESEIHENVLWCLEDLADALQEQEQLDKIYKF